MAAKPFIVNIGGKAITVYQNAHTGLFYTIQDDGRHAPILYRLIQNHTTSRQRLKYWRNRYGYTQADLAELIGVSGSTILMMWENGLRFPCKEYRRLINAELNSDIFPI